MRVETELSRAEARELLTVFAAHRAWSARTLEPVMALPPAVRLRVLLFADQARYLEATSDFAHSLRSNGGFYDGAAHSVYSFREGNGLALLLHEISHAVMGEAFDDSAFERYRRPGWPVWLDEGLAEVLASVELRREGGGYAVRAEPAVKLGALVDTRGRVALPMSTAQILSADMRAYRGPKLDAYYAMAHALVHTLAQRPTELRGLLSELQAGGDPERAVARLVGSLGGPAAVDSLVRSAITAEMNRSWDHPRLLAGPGDTIWNWIPVGSGSAEVHAGLKLDGAPEGRSGPLLLRQIPPLPAASVRLDCDVRRGSLEIILSTSPSRADRPSLRVALGRAGLQLSPPASGGTGRPIELNLPRGTEPARIAVEVRMGRGAGSLRVDGEEIVSFGPPEGLLRGVGIGRLKGSARTGPILIAPLVRTLPAGPRPKAGGQGQGGKRR